MSKFTIHMPVSVCVAVCAHERERERERERESSPIETDRVHLAYLERKGKKKS